MKIVKKLFLNLKKISLKKVKISSNVDFWKTSFDGNNAIGSNTEISYSQIGNMSYIGKNCILNKSKIGNYCSIGSEVKIVYGTHPVDDFFSTHPSFYSVKKQSGFSFVDKAIFNESNEITKNVSIVIESDVWIGSNVIILEGVKISTGAIIAAGSVVTKDVMPFEIVGGVPAKRIRFRFGKDTIKKLLDSKWWEIPEDKLSINLIQNLNKVIENEKNS